MLLGYYQHQMHLGVASYARQAQWIVDSTMAHYGTLPDYWRGDGIVTTIVPERRELIRFLCRAKVPVVALTGDGLATARVVLDNVQIGRMAAEHLLERGFRHLTFFKCTDYNDVREREAGFAAAVEQAGLSYVCLDWLAASRKNRRLDLHTWLSKRLQELPKPMGMMAQSDHRAYHVVNTCQRVGLDIPSQIAVVGVDNDTYTCDLAPIPITSVDSNRQELAYRGAILLDQLMQGLPAPSEPIRIPPTGVVARRSSDILAVEHPDVAKALSFIWQHYSRPIGVGDVVAVTAMSRCGLYRAFQQYIGRTIHEELERKRLEHGQRLLLTSTEKISSIARQTGFANGEQFSRAFARCLGITPSDFRIRRAQASAARVLPKRASARTVIRRLAW